MRGRDDIHRVGFLVHVRSPMFVLRRESPEIPAKVRKYFNICQEPESASRIAVILSWRNSILHAVPPVRSPYKSYEVGLVYYL